MMTKEQYIESLRKLHLNLYRFGEKVENVVDDPIVRPSLNSFAATYELAEDPQYEDLMCATSSLTGKKINRFTHLARRPQPASSAAWVWTRRTLCSPRLMRPTRPAAPSTMKTSRSSGPRYRRTTGR